MIKTTQCILSQKEMLGLFWLFLVGGEDIDTGFVMDSPEVETVNLLERTEQVTDNSKPTLFDFYKKAGLVIKETGWHKCFVSYKDWNSFKQWMLSYLSAYQEGFLSPNGLFLSSQNSQEKTKEILEKYKDIFGLSFNLQREGEIDGQLLIIPLHVRIFEDLLLLKNSGVIDLSVGDLEHPIECFKWPEIQIRILQPILTSLTGSINYLGISITQTNKVYFDGKEININPASDEFKLLKMLVQAQGKVISVFEVYHALRYKNTKTQYYKDNACRYNKVKKPKNNLNKVKNDRLRSTIKRLLAHFEGSSLKITATQKIGVVLKTAD